ncbi:hypothetical protein [Chitinophaga sp. Cy-1792]|uniref:hypothetical protein n=1 Tax=Chitinophaga sp. Cy-1792 TaxID=2608339 RepID=UPI001420DFC4|nr:hypothetical protein [Chitinophaga sp. Cy-1792]NIG55360.1 hypothetical protein [Chitinophaga sp. Cy-1792]
MKKFILLAAACVLGYTSYGQSFMHGAGAVVFVAKPTGGDASAVGGLTYSPRFNFVEKDNMSVSVGVPLSLGLGGSYSSDRGSYSGESNNLKFMFNVPVMFNLNIGCGATPDVESRFGFFVGAGYGYHYQSINENYSDSFENSYSYSGKSSTTGPVGNAGIRFGVGEDHNIEVKFSYMKGITNDKPSIMGIGALFNF